MKGSRGAVLLGGGEGQGKWHGGVPQTALQPQGFHQLQVLGEKDIAEAVGEYCSHAVAESRAGSSLPASAAQLAWPRQGVL